MKRSLLLQRMLPKIYSQEMCCPITLRRVKRTRFQNHNEYYATTTVVEFAKHMSQQQQHSRPHNNDHPNDQRKKQIESFPTVNVYCNTCSIRLFRYKKKNGTKSQLVKCYVERIIEDCVHVLRDQYYNNSRNNTAGNHHQVENNTNTNINTNNNNSRRNASTQPSHSLSVSKQDPTNASDHHRQEEEFHAVYFCPNCQTKIARYARINHLPCLKWVGGKIRMSKK
jgi:hypothetical protein